MDMCLHVCVFGLCRHADLVFQVLLRGCHVVQLDARCGVWKRVILCWKYLYFYVGTREKSGNLLKYDEDDRNTVHVFAVFCHGRKTPDIAAKQMCLNCSCFSICQCPTRG